MIGKKAEQVLNRAVRYAIDQEHEYFTLEHVLWSLIEEADVKKALEACGADVPHLRKELEAFIARSVPKASKHNTSGQSEHPVATLSIQRLIQRALFHVQSAGKDEIHPMDLLVALFQSKDSHALYLMISEGVERLDILNYISHGIRKDAEVSDSSSESGDEEGSEVFGDGAKTGGKGLQDALELYAVCLNDRAADGKIDPLVGRQVELERMIQTLCRRRKNNPLLVGEAGVGKTALAEGLAVRIVEGQVPSILEEAEVYALDLGALLARSSAAISSSA
jgi:ATP-dependent Clp protease ATP-binding subunit ClpA